MLRRYESVKISKILLLVACTHILKSKILRVMLEQLMRTITIMSACSHICVCFLTKSRSFMAIILKFRTNSVIDDQNTKIGTNVPIAKGIEIIEERKIAYNAKEQFFRRCERSTNKRRHTTIDTEATRI